MAENETKIRDSVLALSQAVRLADITLPMIAAESGVSVRTLLRYYSTRDALIHAVGERVHQDVVTERPVVRGDLDGSLELLVDHYEARGRGVLMMLAQEADDPLVAELVSAGKRVHRTWAADLLDSVEVRVTQELLDVVVVATDVYAWKLLRLDRGLTAEQTRGRMRSMVDSLVAHEQGGSA